MGQEVRRLESCREKPQLDIDDWDQLSYLEIGNGIFTDIYNLE